MGMSLVDAAIMEPCISGVNIDAFQQRLLGSLSVSGGMMPESGLV